MTVLTWKTPNDLGSFSAGQNIWIKMRATSNDASSVSYAFHNGTLPSGVKLNSNGAITGDIPALTKQTKYVFTIRAISNSVISDRTFSMVVGASSGLSFQESGLIISTTDATWIDYQLNISNPANESYSVILSGGSLPDGLYLTEAGRICGYASRPINTLTNLPESKTFNFVLTIVSVNTGQTDVENFQIRIALSTARNPVILNKTPPIDYETSEYAAYYDTSGFLGSYKANEEIAFKIIGKDFTGQRIQYVFTNLPSGLTGNQDTGWITGIISKNAQTYQRYHFKVKVVRYNAPTISSDEQTFSFILYNKINPKIVWRTDSVLPHHSTGEQCFVTLKATTPISSDVVFQKTSGQLPPNVTLTTKGELRGKISFQPAKAITIGTSKTYYFTVKAYSKVYPEIHSSRDFALTVNQPFTFPCDKVYFKALPSLEIKQQFSHFINDKEVFDPDAIFRPTDPDFGVCKDIRMYLSYGTKASNITQYIDSMTTNFYTKDLYFGDIKTAIAKDEDGNVIYEVVYVEIHDAMKNANQTSFVNGLQVFPNSIENMRDQLENSLGKNTESSLIPRWMASQQPDGNILGNIPCWVICYCNVGYADNVATEITSSYKSWIQDIPFTIDRIFVDKSQTYNWNSNQTNPTWTSYPGGYPVPNPIDTYDFCVLFPKTEII